MPDTSKIEDLRLSGERDRLLEFLEGEGLSPGDAAVVLCRLIEQPERFRPFIEAGEAAK